MGQIDNDWKINSNYKKTMFHSGTILREHTEFASKRCHEGKIINVHRVAWQYTTAGKIGVGLGALAGVVAGGAIAVAAMEVGAAFGAATAVGVEAGSGIAVGAVRRVNQTAYYYPCCGGDGNSIGCRQEYSCCNGAPDSEGCKVIPAENIKYPCCDGNYGSEGCLRYYSCCPGISADHPNNIYWLQYTFRMC